MVGDEEEQGIGVEEWEVWSVWLKGLMEGWLWWSMCEDVSVYGRVMVGRRMFCCEGMLY